MFVKNTVILSLLIIATFGAENFPSDIKCNHGDSKCSAEVMTHLIRTSFHGIPSLDVGSLDPFKANDSTYHIDIPFKIEFNTTNNRFVGIQHGVVNKVVGFDKDPRTSLFEIYGSFPILTATGNYKVTGNVYGNTINRQGQYTFSFYDSNFKIKLTCSTRTRNEQVYLHVEKVVYESSISRMTIEFGDPILDTLAKRKDNRNVIKKNVDLSFADTFKSTMQHTCDKFPYKAMFNN